MTLKKEMVLMGFLIVARQYIATIIDKMSESGDGDKYEKVAFSLDAYEISDKDAFFEKLSFARNELLLSEREYCFVDGEVLPIICDKNGQEVAAYSVKVHRDIGAGCEVFIYEYRNGTLRLVDTITFIR